MRARGRHRRPSTARPIPESTIEPLGRRPALADLAASDDDARPTALRQDRGDQAQRRARHVAWAWTGPKSLLEVRDGLTFLDIIARQVLALRSSTASTLPLMLHELLPHPRRHRSAPSRRYDDLAVEGLPLDFLQNSEPKLRADDLTPVDWPADPDLEWCPPGHGDLYTALRGTGLLDACSTRGSATRSSPTPTTSARPATRGSPAWFARDGVPFVAEVGARAPSRPQGRPPRPSQVPTAGSCCARPRRSLPARTQLLRRPRPAPVSTPTTCGSTCRRSTRRARPRATASSGCR